MAEHLLANLGLPYSRPGTPGAHSHVQIGWIGLGQMGYYMARNLAKRTTQFGSQPLPLKVWNRTADKAEKLRQQLGKELVVVAKDIEEIATSCDVIITNLANDEVVKEIYEQCARYLRLAPPIKNKIFVETSTILPRLSGELDYLVSHLAHCHYISSPVFGRPNVADKAQLLIVMAGEYRSKKEAAYLLVPAVGRKVIDLGENVEKAPTFKLLGNSMILGAVEVIAEAYTLGDKAGIEAGRINDLIGEILPAPGLMGYADRMARDDYDGVDGFSLDGGIKDASHIRHLTAKYNAPMPMIDIAHQRLITARAIHTAQKEEGTQSLDVLDWTALIAGSRVAAGLDPFNSRKDKAVVEEA
ncbi:NAD-P-binding protein [Lentinula aciculospora]|uniref:NAD-P-binding protein n=1 Tax=Lentinula aciculospora TaxID=153920 RepID=A0A9W9ANR2_9AGAR|nr:NAD-P-binding protein [Lentinula aciculospora]